MNLVKPEGERLVYLDSARGLAAFGVMISHYIVSFHATTIFLSPAFRFIQLFYYGEGDILFFFVHSGFILCYAISNRIVQTKISAYGRFLTERVFRIYPMFIFIVLISYMLKQSIFPLSSGAFTTAHLQQFWQRNGSLNELFNELLLIHSGSPEGARRLVPQEWTSAIEILVGCMIPILFVFLKWIRWSLIYWGTVLFVIKVLGFNFFLFDFALGVYLYYQSEQIKKTWLRLSIQMKCCLFALAILFFSCFFRFGSLFNFERVLIRPGIDHGIVSIGCGLFFSIIISSSTLQKLLSHPWLVAIGRVCYSLYLVHMMILICFADYLVQEIQKLSGLSVNVCIVIFFIFYFVLTFFLSLLTFRIVEKPFNQLGKRIAKKIENRFVSTERQFFKKRL